MKENRMEEIKLEPYYERSDATVISDKNFEMYMGIDAVAVSYAEGGAMGSPGGVEIVTRDGKWYTTNYAFGTMYWNQLLEVIPMLGEVEFGFHEPDKCPDGWRPYDLGMGNHLFIKADISEQFEALVSDVKSPSQLYRRWPFAVNEILTMKCLEKPTAFSW